MERMATNAATGAQQDAEQTGTTSSLEGILNTRFIVNVAELCARLDLPASTIEDAAEASQGFPLLFPESTLSRVRKNDPNDPVLKQFLPSKQELETVPGFSCDPLCEHQLTVSEQDESACVLQKYAGRALVITTNACAGRCRFCFRRYFPKNRALFPLPKEAVDTHDATDKSKLAEQTDKYFDRAFASVRNNPTISELIFSGGDPLTLPNESLTALLYYIRRLGHVKRVRFHTRVPVLTPGRIGEDFPAFDDFQEGRELDPLILHIALHINAPEEIDETVVRSLLKLRRKGYILTSQTVLLRGINDNVDTLVRLYEKLVNLGVIPYYLFQLDRVQGAAHFETPVSVGRALIEKLSERVPGYAVPQYSREIAGRPMKTNLFIDRSEN